MVYISVILSIFYENDFYLFLRKYLLIFKKTFYNKLFCNKLFCKIVLTFGGNMSKLCD